MSTCSVRLKRSGCYGPPTAVMLTLLAGMPGLCAAAERRIELAQQLPNDAVMITKVMLGNSEVKCGAPVGLREFQPVVPFEAGGDWLQNLTVELLNRTSKTIAWMDIVLEFPETGDGQVPGGDVSLKHRQDPLVVGAL